MACADDCCDEAVDERRVVVVGCSCQVASKEREEQKWRLTVDFGWLAPFFDFLSKMSWIDSYVNDDFK
jgi:hypothetical protein